MITQDDLKKYLSYNSDTGLFTRLISRGRFKAGTISGAKKGNGYIVVTVMGVEYLSHRLAWLYTEGRFPDGFIDHIDGNAQNNIFSNLRNATNQQNLMNRGKNKNNTYGYKGVTRHKQAGKWMAQIMVDRKHRSLGVYSDIKDAARAYEKAVSELYPIHGRV